MLDEFQRDEAMIHFQRGLVLERANRVQEAVEEYRRAIARYPHFREAHDALGFYYQRYGLLAKAAEEFRVVANLEDDFLSHFNLGYVLLELSRYDESYMAFKRCLELMPGDPATHYEVAYILFLRGDYLGALEQLQSPLRHYAEDWEVHNLVGRCKLRLGDYDEALASFHNALRFANRPSAQAEAIEHISTVERYRETGEPRSVKDRLYADHGVVCLGSAQDDGLGIRESSEYHFTYPDIGMTVRRFLALVAGCDWHFTCVVGLDRLARPLSAALAELLGLPLRETEALDPDDLPLLVLAIGREAELLELALERVPGETVAFCLGLNWMRHSPMLPDITGVIVRNACSVPWEPELRRLRSDGAPAAQVEQCLDRAAAQITAAIAEILPDRTLAPQVRYYAEDHRSLRFADVFDEITSLII